ncbi:MAG: cytochrome c-type biogenesis protein [Duodenibacillus sp.]|nr:cytochrome c-type biogenesis protein [Duodenibacillus sp.]
MRGWISMTCACLLAFNLAVASAPVAAASETPAPTQSAPKQKLSGQALYQEAIAISKLLRDPASANYTLYDSESAIAGELKARIYEMLRDGKSRQEIFDFMIARYGEMICYEPEFSAKTALLWFAPWLTLAAGGLLLVMRMRRKKRTAQAQSEELK